MELKVTRQFFLNNIFSCRNFVKSNGLFSLCLYKIFNLMIENPMFMRIKSGGLNALILANLENGHKIADFK